MTGSACAPRGNGDNLGAETQARLGGAIRSLSAIHTKAEGGLDAGRRGVGHAQLINLAASSISRSLNNILSRH